MVAVHNITRWIMPDGAFNWIYKNIQRGSTILELGSGLSSIILSINYKIHSVEQNKDWLNLGSKVNYIHAPIENGFYDCDILKRNLPSDYDLLILDGPTEASGGRSGFLKNIKLFNTDCPILLDDVHRPTELKLLEDLAKTLDREYEIFTSGIKKFGVIE